MHKEGGRKVGEREKEKPRENVLRREWAVPGRLRVAAAQVQVPGTCYVVVTLGRQVAKREADPGPTQAVDAQKALQTRRGAAPVRRV